MVHPQPGAEPGTLADNTFGLATLERSGALVPAVVTGRGVLLLAALVADAPASVRDLLPEWDSWCDRIEAALPTADGWLSQDEVSFGPPLPDPANLYLAGANYYDHVAEMMTYIAEMNGKPLEEQDDEVFHFMVPTSSLVGTGHDVIRPAGADQLDWEVELAVVIARPADSVSAEDAMDYVAGYAIANDVSLRGPKTMHPIFGVRFMVAKGQRTLTPMGPTIVPARFVPHPNKLALSTRVNGQLRQDSNTEQMISTVAEQIAHLSQQSPLCAGDIILTGTPAGTAAAYGAFLADGDVVSMTVEGLGELVNTIVASPAAAGLSAEAVALAS